MDIVEKLSEEEVEALLRNLRPPEATLTDKGDLLPASELRQRLYERLLRGAHEQRADAPVYVSPHLAFAGSLALLFASKAYEPFLHHLGKRTRLDITVGGASRPLVSIHPHVSGRRLRSDLAASEKVMGILTGLFGVSALATSLHGIATRSGLHVSREMLRKALNAERRRLRASKGPKLDESLAYNGEGAPERGSEGRSQSRPKAVLPLASRSARSSPGAPRTVAKAQKKHRPQSAAE